MELSLSSILTASKTIKLSKLKICNAVMLAFLINIVLQFSNKAYGYTVWGYTWPGINTTYSVNLGTFYNGMVNEAANDWNNSFSVFEFFVSGTSVNSVITEALPPSYSMVTYNYPGSNRQFDHFVIKINTQPQFMFYTGTGTPPSNYWDFRSVLRHEFGHALGLGHSLASDTLMNGVPLGMTRSVDNDAVNGSLYLYSSSYTGVPPERSWYNLTVPPYSTAGTYDDQSSSISYGGRTDHWSPLTAVSNAGFSTISRSSTIGSRSNIEVTGANNVTLFYSMGPDRRTADIYIDNVLQPGPINAQAAEYRRQVGRTWSLTTSPHTFEVRFGPNSGFFDVDMFAVNIGTVSAGSYDDTHPQFRYIGTWTPVTGVSGAFNNTHALSQTAGSLFRFTFTGQQVSYYYTTANNRGKAAITVDGIDVGYIDMYSATTQRQQGQTYGIGAGTHVLHVTVTGQKNPASLGTFVDVDRLIVE